MKAWKTWLHSDFVKNALLVAALAASVIFFFLGRPAAGDSYPIVQQGPGGAYGSWKVAITAGTATIGAVTPPGSTTVGTGIACNSGTSPCNITNSAANVLNQNTSRKSCFVCANDAQDVYCKRATAVSSAATTTNFDFILNAGSAALKTGGCWYCDSAGAVWQGPLNCLGSASTSNKNLTVGETN